MSKSIETSLKELLFKKWMGESHPYFYAIYGVIVLLLLLTFITSLVLPFFNIEWWWKLSLLSVGLFLGTKINNNSYIINICR